MLYCGIPSINQMQQHLATGVLLCRAILVTLALTAGLPALLNPGAFHAACLFNFAVNPRFWTFACIFLLIGHDMAHGIQFIGCALTRLLPRPGNKAAEQIFDRCHFLTISGVCDTVVYLCVAAHTVLEEDLHLNYDLWHNLPFSKHKLDSSFCCLQGQQDRKTVGKAATYLEKQLHLSNLAQPVTLCWCK